MTTQDAAPQAERGGSEFAELRRRVHKAKLLDRRPGYYMLKVPSTVALYAAGWVGLFMISGWWNLITAVFLAVMATQVAFVGHDAGHQQIFRTKKASNRVGLALGSLVGLSICWWTDKHNRHHANPNHIDKDPDVGKGALVFTKRQAAERSSTAGHFLARNQAYLFFPMLLLEGINLHVASIRAMLDPTVESKRMRALESLGLLLHISLYLTAVFAVLTPGQAVTFIAVQQGLFGLYMGLSFAPNHKGMRILEADEKLDYLRRQVLTSRNVRGRFVGWILGGLNYQIEHHLFPSMPRPNLKRAQHIVRPYCNEIEVPYTETSIRKSYGEVLRHLRDVGASA